MDGVKIRVYTPVGKAKQVDYPLLVSSYASVNVCCLALKKRRHFTNVKNKYFTFRLYCVKLLLGMVSEI